MRCHLNTHIKLESRNTNEPLRVLIIGRISTEHQDLENINASFRYVEEYLARVYDGPTEITRLGERASGMLLDRQSIREAEDLIAAGSIDLVIAEDLSRIFRNPRHQYNFVQDVVDAETRLICIADNLDTANDSWELMLGAATLRHGLTVSDTRRRVRRTATHSFHRGGMVQKVKFGYRKLTPSEAKDGTHGPVGLAVARDRSCTPIIEEMASRAKRGDSFVSIAEWLNSGSVDPPPYATGNRWTGRLVKDLLRDPILKGVRVFRRTLSRPVFRTGRYRRVQNDSPETALHPELAHLTTSDFDELQDILDRREAAYGGAKGRDHPLYGRSRKRSLWPAQHARCSICGDMLYRFDTDYLKCKNSGRNSADRCWNHLQVDCAVLRQKLLTPLLAKLIRYPSFISTLRDSTLAEIARLQAHQQTGSKKSRDLDGLRKQAANLANAIAAGGELQPLIDRLTAINGQIKEATSEPVESTTHARPRWTTIESSLADHMISISATSFEFADLVRRTNCHLEVHPVQALDTPQVKAIGCLELDILRADQSYESLSVEAYLFDPPLHIQYVQQCVALKRRHPALSMKKIAKRIGTSHMTVKRSLDYASLMSANGLGRPYRLLIEKPANASRWKQMSGS